MNAIMNEKGRQTKLLAAIAIIAMVVCAFAVAMPAGESDAAPVDVVTAPDNAVEVDTAEELETEITRGTQNIEIVATISVTDTINSILAANQSIWITGDGKLTINGGTMTINGTVYNNVGTNQSNSGLALTSGTVTFGDTGRLYSVCAVSVGESINASAYFTSTDTAVDGTAQYQHYYSGNISSLVPIVTDNTNYSDESIDSGRWIYSYGDKIITGSVDLGDAGLYVVAGTVTVASGATLVADVIEISAVGGITNNGVIVAHAFDSDTESSIDAVKITGNVAFRIPEGMTATVNETIITVTGTPVATDDATYSNYFDSANSIYAYAGIVGIPTGQTTVEQNNTALPAAWPEDSEFADNIKTSTINFSSSDNTLYFLVPSNGGVVTVTFTVGSDDEAVSTKYTFNFTVSGTTASVGSTDAVAEALQDDNVDSIIYTGTDEITVTNLNKPLTVNSLEVLGDDTSIAEGGQISVNGEINTNTTPFSITAGNGNTVTLGTSDGAFTAGSIRFYYGSGGVDFTDGAGTLGYTGEGKIQGTVTGDMTLSMADGATPATVDADGAIILSDNVTLTIGAGVTLNAGSYIELADGADNATIEVTGTFAYNTLPAGITIENKGGTIKIQDGMGIENQIYGTVTVSGTQYLSSTTTINEGATLIVPRGATLDLNGKDLIVYGTLIIENRGVVTNGVSGTVSIQLMSSGSIENSGTIGDTTPIRVSNGANSTANQYIEMQGVNGVSITMQMDRNTRTYDMSVSGTVSTVTGTTTNKLSLNNVNISADMTIGRNIEFSATNTIVENNVTFVNNGKFATLTNFVLYNGASAVINSPTSGIITVATGQVDTGNTMLDSITSSVEFDGSNTSGTVQGTVGMTVSVGRVTIVNDDGDNEVYQRMYISGTLETVTSANTQAPNGEIGLGGAVFISETLTVTQKVGISAIDSQTYYIDVSTAGTVVVQDRGTSGPSVSLNYSGARYVVSTTENNVTTDTEYYTSFANAIGTIGTAQNGIIYIAGEYMISGTYTVGADQEIELESSRYTGTIVDGIVVAEDGQITVDSEGYVNPDAFDLIEGRVIALEGIGYVPTKGAGIYAVVTVDEDTYDTTYSGFKLAVDNASNGDTITVVDNAEYDGNLVIPAGVTVEVNATFELTVTGNVTVETEGELILNNASTLSVGRTTATSTNTITVSGVLDASEGGQIASNGAAVSLYSTGTTTVMSTDDILSGVTPNAAYYDDVNIVYTSLANAIAYAEENAIDEVRTTGIFSETADLATDGVSIIIGGQVTLGNISINDATISVASPGDFWYTAIVSGLNGSGDSTGTISFTRTNATVESEVTTDATGANTYALTFNGVKGATAITAGIVEFVGAAGQISLTTSLNDSLTVASGATLLIGEDTDVSLDASYLTNNGTIQIDGDVTIVASAEIGGTINVAEDASLTVSHNTSDPEYVMAITGTLNVDPNGRFIVYGNLQVGETPELLTNTTTGEVIGKIVLDEDSYIVVFNGASVADATITDNASAESRSTAYTINGTDLATIYAIGNGTNVNVINQTVYGLKDLATTEEVNGSDSPITIVWYDGETAVSSTDTAAGLTTYVGVYDSLSTEIQYSAVYVTISVGSHISLSVDNVIINNYGGGSYPLTIGTHTVSVVVDPGYSGDVTITFNGQTITNGQITVTSEMLTQLNAPVLSATGQLSQDSTVVIDGGSSGDSGMGLTDYLLIILVILIVVMAIIVALRLMRS